MRRPAWRRDEHEVQEDPEIVVIRVTVAAVIADCLFFLDIVLFLDGIAFN